MPMGCDQSRWTPRSEGTLDQLSPILDSLAPVKDKTTILTNMELRPAYPGSHATSNSSFLSAVKAKVTESSDYYLGTTADQVAAQQMGDLQDVAVAMQACPELRSWSYRYPRIAVVVYPLTCLALLPAMPVIAGVAHAPQLARWGACMLLGGAVTAAMFLVMQLSISLG